MSNNSTATACACGTGLIQVVVKSQKGPFQGEFSKPDTVNDVIVAATRKLGFDPSDRFELVLASDRKHPLDPCVTLGSLLKDENGRKPHLELVLTAIGSGV